MTREDGVVADLIYNFADDTKVARIIKDEEDRDTGTL